MIDQALGAGRWLAGIALALITWFGHDMLSEIRSSQRRAAEVQYGIDIKLAGIDESIKHGTVASARTETQVERLRTEVIDLRMRVNTLESRLDLPPSTQRLGPVREP